VPQTTLDWDGDAWEEYCLNLLRMRYKAPGQFEHVPSADQGDLGIEGFSHDGCVYQCYAPQGPLPIKDRYEKQRDKLTEDVSKLETHQTELVAILGGIAIRVYVFMTPIHDSRRLNQHAKAKAAEIRAKGLPHCAPEFDVVIHTEANYAVERNELIALGLQKWKLAAVPVPHEAVQSYVASNPDLIATIDGKLARLPDMTADDRMRLRSRLLVRKLTADNKLDEIRGHHAAAWEYVQELRAGKEAALEIECSLSSANPRDLLNDTANAYRDILKSSLVFLNDVDASDLAWGTTTDWLAECPLDFRAASGS
jgi:hypothetical protein